MKINIGDTLIATEEVRYCMGPLLQAEEDCIREGEIVTVDGIRPNGSGVYFREHADRYGPYPIDCFRQVVLGQNITQITTLKSQYDNDCVLIVDDKGNEYRMPCSTITQMVNEFSFLKEKKTKHTYLLKANLNKEAEK